MPASDADIYAPVGLGWFWPLIGIIIFTVIVGGYYGWRWLRIRMALEAQKRLTQLQKPNKEALIAQALRRIQELQSAVSNSQLTSDQGAEELSHLVRSTFDTLMNHRTLYAARYEVAERHLQRIEQMLGTSYPLEYATSKPPTFDQLCSEATEVVQSCR